MTPTARRRLSWDDIERDCLDLAGRVSAAGPFVGIVAVVRGGLVPAALLARALDLRRVETVCLSSYAGVTRHRLEVLKAAEMIPDGGRGWLVVDDLADTGATLSQVRAMLPFAHRATLYVKPAGEPVVETYIAKVAQDLWIDFPWESPA